MKYIAEINNNLYCEFSLRLKYPFQTFLKMFPFTFIFNKILNNDIIVDPTNSACAIPKGDVAGIPNQDVENIITSFCTTFSFPI
jgi:hypothetical protein